MTDVFVSPASPDGLAVALFAFAAAAFVLHLASLTLAWRACRPAPAVEAPPDAPPMTLVRVLCGVEPTTPMALDLALAQAHPRLCVLFCVARVDDPVIPYVEAALAAHPHVEARLLIGEDRLGANPKLNNMAKAWLAARTDHVLFLDSNLMPPTDWAARAQAALMGDAAVVSAPPVGAMPSGAAAHVEAAFLNTHAARWQYAAGAVGHGFAQGKTLLFSRRALPLGDLSPLANEPAEDAAATRLAREAGRQVALIGPPAAQWLGRRPWPDVWRRQLRWARLRRATFPALYTLEIVAGPILPALVATLALARLDALEALAPLAALWWGAEWALARSAGWPAGWRDAVALAARDALLPVLWAAGWFGGAVEWRGAPIALAARRPAGAPSQIGAVWRKSRPFA